jgi:hypothetical protein
VTNSWHILRTHAGSEFKIETAVQQIGVTAYCPKIMIRRRLPFDRRKIVVVRKAIYPSYIFVAEHFPIEAIVTTKLRAHWLHNGSGLALIASIVLDSVEESERLGEAVEAVAEMLRCMPRQRPKVKRAPFSRDVKDVLGRVAA